jgi:surface antigen
VHVVRPDHAALERAVRWVVLVLAALVALMVVLTVVVTSPARADPGAGPGGGPGAGPDQTGPDQQQLVKQFQQAQLNGTPTGTAKSPNGQDVWVGVPGTHAANHGYGYPYPAAGDCNEATLGGGCVGDARGFIQGQCTSWVAFRLAARNYLSFSNWYAGRHWGNASEWAKVAKSIGHKADKTPAIGSIGWYKRGHVSYVEDVYGNGSILISEMNSDGHNGFHFAVVTPGMHSYPDKFIHLDDVVPVDTTPPTVPTGFRVVHHRDRTGIAWRHSNDAFGVAGYRVYRDGTQIATTRAPSYWDRTAPADQSAVYSVVAYDAAGHASAPGRVRAVPASEAVDRAWVDTAAGPAFCGRSGTTKKPRVACRLLADSGWRSATMDHDTSWGGPLGRSFVQDVNGQVSYCRNVGASQRTPVCTAFDVARRTWAADVTSSQGPRLALDDRAWVGSTVGPAQCGRSGTEADPHITCSVLTPSGWQTTTTTRRTSWGDPASRAFVGTRDGSIAFCRALGPSGRQRLACTLLHVPTLTWQRDIVADGRLSANPSDATWVASNAGAALCSSPSRGDRGGCRVLSAWGWRNARLPKGAVSGTARAFVTDPSGQVSWCRITRGGRSTACASLADDGSSWSAGSSGRVPAALGRGSALNRTWVPTSVGPALCGRTGTARQQRVGCQVLTDDGWRFTVSQRTPWGLSGYRAFVPAGAGVAYCRTVDAKRGTSVACTRMVRSDWGATRTSRPTRMVLPDPF